MPEETASAPTPSPLAAAEAALTSTTELPAAVAPDPTKDPLNVAKRFEV